MEVASTPTLHCCHVGELDAGLQAMLVEAEAGLAEASMHTL
jgi:hypothetical protein